MTGLTPEKRAALRAVCDEGFTIGHDEWLDLSAAELRALLDAADERDRIRAELGDPSKHYIMDGWLVIDTGRHTCGTDPGGHYGTHEPGCGLEDALRLDNLPGWPGDERDRLAAAAERVRELHSSDRWCNNPAHTDLAVSCPDCYVDCVECGVIYPCATIRALDGVERARREALKERQ